MMSNEGHDNDREEAETVLVRDISDFCRTNLMIW